MVIHLQEQAIYASFKAWLSVVEDWVSSQHPYHAQQFGTGDHPHCGSFDNEPEYIFLAGDLWWAGDDVG